MRNIIDIIAKDIKKLSVNVVAMVVIIGLTVIPCLYAWFNILSNWDPYGPDATKNLQVAVATSDQGILIGNYELNVGDIIVENLKGNSTIGWVFTDTADEAISGVHSGDFYAAIVIDEEFSSNMISFLGGEIENPKITYYENDKKNAIAPKITGKVKTTIEREVDHAFVSTMAEALLKASEYFATLDEQGNITGQGIAKLERLDSDLNGLIALLDSYVALMDSTESITEAGEAVTESAESITELAGQMSQAAQQAGASAQTDVQKVKDTVDDKVTELNTALANVDSKIAEINSLLEKETIDPEVDKEKLEQDVEQAKEQVEIVNDYVDNELKEEIKTEAEEAVDVAEQKADTIITDAKNDLNTTMGQIEEEYGEYIDLATLYDRANKAEEILQEVQTSGKELSQVVEEKIQEYQPYIEDAQQKVDQQVQQANENIKAEAYREAQKIIEEQNLVTLEDVTAYKNEIETKLNESKNALTQDVSKMLSDTATIREQYGTVVSPLMQSAIDSTNSSIAEIEKLLNYNATSINLVMENLDNYGDLLNQSKDSIVKSRDEAVEMESLLAALIHDIKSLNQNEAYQKFMTLLKSDPDLLSDFISSPVEISDEYIYPIENNGSMTAPFYIVLSIWVGSLIMSTILKTTIKDKSGLENLKNWQCFFGRYFTTFVIGQIQTLITVLGAFLFVGIQCDNHFLFWLACAWTSFVYSLLLYSFAYSFGNIGEALSVILMVIQVAGAGGTFPIEVLPKVFQVLYKFMPFNYSMNAVRECIAGFYENTYRNCMLTLAIYLLIAIFIGVVLYHPFKMLNEKIEISKEKSGILL